MKRAGHHKPGDLPGTKSISSDAISRRPSSVFACVARSGTNQPFRDHYLGRCYDFRTCSSSRRRTASPIRIRQTGVRYFSFQATRTAKRPRSRSSTYRKSAGNNGIDVENKSNLRMTLLEIDPTTPLRGRHEISRESSARPAKSPANMLYLRRRTISICRGRRKGTETFGPHRFPQQDSPQDRIGGHVPGVTAFGAMCCRSSHARREKRAT